MTRLCPFLALTASCMLATAFSEMVFASDLTLYYGSAPATPQHRQTEAVDKARRSIQATVKHQVRRDRKTATPAQAALRQQAILTYGLSREPFPYLNREPAGHGRVDILGHISASLTAGADLYPPPKVPGTSAGAQERAGIAFGCRERPFGSTLLRRDVTACFRTSIEGAWRAQTYVSRGYSQGMPTWGGGLTLAYAY